MKITIIGAGAMGCLFGGLLTDAGQQVRLLDTGPEHVQALNETGLFISGDGRKRYIRVQAFLDPADIKETDLALIFVKHAQTGDAARIAARLLRDDGYVMTLQNGMGNAEIIAEAVGRDRVICGTTAQGAMRLGHGHIQHSGVGTTTIGMWGQPRRPIVDKVAEILTEATIPTGVVDNIVPVIWNKLFANVGINGVTALTGIRNGQLLDLEVTRNLVRALVGEAMAVARALQVEVAPDVVDNVFAIARATAVNRSSMGQDVDVQRATEIDAINGYIVAQAEKLGLDTPVNRMLTALIKTLEFHYL